jgi:hypothetical protein
MGFIYFVCRDTRQHDNAKEEWSDDDLKRLYETHERLLDLVSLFCFVPRSKYLPLGPTRYICRITFNSPICGYLSLSYLFTLNPAIEI